VDGGAAPGVPGQAADAELHRPGRPGGVLAGAHAGRAGAALAGFDFADPGQHGPRDAVPGSGFAVVGEVGGGDRGRRGAGAGLGLAGGGLAEYPGSGAEERRGQQDQRLNAAITARQGEVERLVCLVGDAEAVAGEYGWLPAERRGLVLAMFSARRVSEVRELRLSAARRQAELSAAKGRPERARIRAALRKDTCRLEFLEGIPPMTAADMCSEWIRPARWHHPDSTCGDAGQVSGPCPGWPRWAQQIRKLRQDLLALSGRPSQPPQPKPEPLAAIPSGLPIEEVLTRLAAVRAEHPGTVVRRGSRNRWAIWPAQQDHGG
jgi:hypothetical protein